ncbi:hypothetical protein HJG60_008172 [Phyllostomus discolor]|uniref:Uncharacterized protein n=1 Tax=Phyllostomus discolor TaxID=89673 RepID=A0A834DQ32_9CHIR|nr:hypothetical protein HJG60_008172 [Phyllostomus discolor]
MVSFKALKNTLFCLISHCDHISIETIMFVLSTDMCASIKGTQLPNVSCGSSGEWLFTPQPSGPLQKAPENKQMVLLAHDEGHWREVLGAGGVTPRKTGAPVHGDSPKGQITSPFSEAVSKICFNPRTAEGTRRV